MPSRPNLQIFGVGVQGASPVVTAARRVNCYHDVQPQADRTKVAIHGLPGLVAFCNLGDTPVRGLFSHGPYIYAVHRDTFYRLRNDGVQESKGTLDTSEGYVYFDANNAGEIAFVDGTSGYVWDTVGETFAKITDADFPAAPHYITTARGYGVVPYGTVGQWIIDAGDDFTAWDALDFSTADAHPDTLVAALWQSDVLMLLGTDSTEYWGYTGSADFPFARIAGSAYGWGLDARGSLARLGTGAIGLMRYQEQVRVARIAGAEPVNVTPPNLANVLNGYSRTDDARGTVFTHNGHELYQITFPTAGATWVYDSATGVWSERISYGLTTHRGLLGVQHQGTTYWGDVASGQVWKQDDATWTDGGDPLVMTLRSEHVFDRNRRLAISAVEFDFATGTGLATGQGSDPQVSLRISRDKGRSFGAERRLSIGKVGRYQDRVRATRLGQARDWVFEISISDPIPRVLTGETLSVS